MRPIARPAALAALFALSCWMNNGIIGLSIEGPIARTHSTMSSGNICGDFTSFPNLLNVANCSLGTGTKFSLAKKRTINPPAK